MKDTTETINSRPPIVAIVGRPNVGKSTLFNRLSRSRSALVDDRPGITRDRLYVEIACEGVPLTLVDTGGFDDLNPDPLHRAVRAQVEKAIQEADCVIFMVDGRQGLLPADEEIADILRRSRKPVRVAVNKVDSPELEGLTLDFYRFGWDSVHPLSAAHGYGLRAFLQALVRDLPVVRTRPAGADQIRVAVLGKPNVGKSSLINRLLGSDRLLVSERPGTTRDAVDTLCSFDHQEYLLIDTAGIRRKARVSEKIEKFSAIKALASLDRCHVALILLDAAEGVTEQDVRVCGYAFEKGKGVVLAVNKWDLVKADPRLKAGVEGALSRELKYLSFAPRIRLSALTGERVLEVFQKIRLVYEHSSRRVGTPELNKALGEVVEQHPPPRGSAGRLKFFYATQTRVRPPTFVVFVNRPELIHFSYERYLVNQLRRRLGLDTVPVRLTFRKR